MVTEICNRVDEITKWYEKYGNRNVEKRNWNMMHVTGTRNMTTEMPKRETEISGTWNSEVVIWKWVPEMD